MILIILIRDKINKDDFIGTCFLSLTDISAAGDNGIDPSPCPLPLIIMINWFLQGFYQHLVQRL